MVDLWPQMDHWGKITNITCVLTPLKQPVCPLQPVKTSDQGELTYKSAASEVSFLAKASYGFLATGYRRTHRKWLNFPSGCTEVTYSIVLRGDTEDV